MQREKHPYNTCLTIRNDKHDCKQMLDLLQTSQGCIDISVDHKIKENSTRQSLHRYPSEKYCLQIADEHQHMMCISRCPFRLQLLSHFVDYEASTMHWDQQPQVKWEWCLLDWVETVLCNTHTWWHPYRMLMQHQESVPITGQNFNAKARGENI